MSSEKAYPVVTAVKEVPRSLDGLDQETMLKLGPVGGLDSHAVIKF